MKTHSGGSVIQWLLKTVTFNRKHNSSYEGFMISPAEIFISVNV